MDKEKGFIIEGYSYISYNNYTLPKKCSRGITVISAYDDPFCLQIDKESGERVLQLVEGDFCIIFPGTYYHFYTQPETQTRILSFEFGLSDDAIPIRRLEKSCEELTRLLQSEREYIVASADKELCSLMLLLQNCHEQQHKTGRSFASVEYITAALLCKLAEQAFGRQTSAMYCSHTKNAIAYISKNFKNEITLRSLCEAVGIGERRMQVLFREELDTTFGEYLATFRINKACDLLRSNTLSVEEIALATGFNSRQHFTLSFKKKTGQSPQQFRTATKQRNYRYRREDISSLQYVFSSFEGSIVE